jgi:ceramide glucosyltransferase
MALLNNPDIPVLSLSQTAIANIILLCLCIPSIFYYFYSIYAAIDFFAAQPESDRHTHLKKEGDTSISASVISSNLKANGYQFHPPLTILKPLCGIDWQIYQDLASFCQQDYPEYQIIFSVQDPADPSIEIVKKIIQDFPDRDLQLVINTSQIGINPKINNLASAITAAKYPILLISDSDIRVETNYLQRVIQPMQDAEVGVITCLYKSLTQGWLSAFEALQISTQFHPSVLTSRQLGGIKFAFGSTIVIRQSVLEEIGGLSAIADYLADDYQLGYLSAQKGYKVVLSDYIVAHQLANTKISDFINRQARWAKCIRVENFWGYLGLIFTQGTVSSSVFLILSQGSLLGWLVLGITWSARLLMAWIVGVHYLQDAIAQKYLWLVPLRDFVSFGIWCYSLVDNTVEWRAQKFKLVKGGKLTPVSHRP